MLQFPLGRKRLSYLPREKGLNCPKEQDFHREKWTKLFFPLGRKGLCSLGELVPEYLNQNYKGKIYPNQNYLHN
jgi:hypothetical protein